MNIPIDNRPPSITSSDEDSDIGKAREFKRMKSRLAELELMYSTRFQFQVMTALTERRRSLARCGIHPHIIVDDHSNRVECAECGEEMDPIDVLRQFANQERTFAHQLEHLRKEKSDLGVEVEALKKQKAALRSAVRKLGGTPVERWQIKAPSDDPDLG